MSELDGHINFLNEEKIILLFTPVLKLSPEEFWSYSQGIGAGNVQWRREGWIGGTSLPESCFNSITEGVEMWKQKELSGCSRSGSFLRYATGFQKQVSWERRQGRVTVQPRGRKRLLPAAKQASS